MMRSQAQPLNRALDESAWVYLAARDDDSRFSEMLAEACEHLGFAVYPSEMSDSPGHEPAFWVDAIRHADVCVIDLGAASVLTGAELATAYCTGRPVVALRGRDEVLPASLASLTDHHGRVRQVVFDDAQDCVAQLASVLRDPAWQQVVRSATHAEPL